jgi:hypothetical protein
MAPRCRGLIFLRSTFGSSTLVRLMGEGVPVDDEASSMDFAERLSLWVSAFDAIGVQASLQGIRALATAPTAQAAPGRGSRPPDLAEDFRQARAVLAKAIAQDPRSLEPADGADGADAGFAPYHRRHLELQRQMEQMVGALRDHVRQAVSRRSPRLRQLAALDATLEPLLATREQMLLPKAAALLKARFEQLRATEDGPAAFARHWQDALLAELDLRLEPVAGLIAALGNELKNRP